MKLEGVRPDGSRTQAGQLPAPIARLIRTAIHSVEFPARCQFQDRTRPAGQQPDGHRISWRRLPEPLIAEGNGDGW
ncbi:MAG: hypothetical protein L0332_26995 [Chloroflexi bacterium]|nr:hypothetical protein [Chloroflexota bacterium]MCI0581180.1 hypothetical protein [Chloroflexota bacterium]MCI0645581.1 hypothetical protein [Chloroflexota bacterium]MCI0730346.1 hypothetical protein [Chloroflexota bacterium]